MDPFYLDLDGGQALVLLHLPAGPRRSTGVLIVPPYGWEDVCSYRSRRRWAEHLAGAGHLCLRLELPGTGDSDGSPRDAGLVAAWTGAVAGAAGWLREAGGCTRVAAIGIGLGGLLAVRAAAGGAGLDDLVLWAAPVRGRNVVRELEAFASLERETDAPGGPGGAERAAGVVAGGFLLSDESAAALRSLDLTSEALPPHPSRRALLLDRDGLAPDRRLTAHLQASGTAVTTAPGPGFGAMMEDPRLARPPLEVFARVGAWLAAAPDEGPSPLATCSVPARSEALVTVDRHVRETPISFQHGARRLFGILASPVEDPVTPLCAVLLNAGAIRRIGPNRMWVETARRWAARGVPTLRVDLPGLGDSDGDERRYSTEDAYYTQDMTTETLRLLDELAEQGLPERFVLAGLCSGAYWSFQAALRDRRVAGAAMINLWSFFWSPELRDERAYDHARVLFARRENFEWALPVIARGLVRSPQRPLRRWARGREIRGALDLLRDRQVQLTLELGRGEPLRRDLERHRLAGDVRRWPNLELGDLPSFDHTCRALHLQRQVHAALDATLDRALSTTGAWRPGAVAATG